MMESCRLLGRKGLAFGTPIAIALDAGAIGQRQTKGFTMAKFSIDEKTGRFTLSAELSEGFTESTTGKTMPAIDARGMSRKVQFGTFKSKTISGALNVYIDLGATDTDRKVVKL